MFTPTTTSPARLEVPVASPALKKRSALSMTPAKSNRGSQKNSTLKKNEVLETLQEEKLEERSNESHSSSSKEKDVSESISSGSDERD